MGVDIGGTVSDGAHNNAVNLTTQAVGLEDEGGSSTGSTDVSLMHGRHRFNMTDNMVVVNEESQMIPAENRGEIYF